MDSLAVLGAAHVRVPRLPRVQTPGVDRLEREHPTAGDAAAGAATDQRLKVELLVEFGAELAGLVGRCLEANSCSSI